MSPANDDLAVPTRSSELQVRGQAAPEVSATWGHSRAVCRNGTAGGSCVAV